MMLYLLELAASVILFRIYILFATKKQLLDKPNERSSHIIPTPRGGGVIFVIIWSILMLSMNFSNTKIQALIPWLVIPALIIALVGFIDDMKSLSSRFRICVHGLCCGIFTYYLYAQFPSHNLPIFWFCAWFISLWSINLFNFMDGMDGLAATQALSVFAINIAAAYLYGSEDFLHIYLTAGIVLFGFLLFNFPKASLFMGDVGSGFLGFLILALGLTGLLYEKIPLWITLISYSNFILDASMTLFRRIFNKEKWFAAHRKHAYQRLHHRALWSHKKVLFVNFIIQLLIGSMILLSLEKDLNFYWPLLVALIINGVYFYACEKLAPFPLTSH